MTPLYFIQTQDLFSALIKGPTRTPYEDGLFLFDIQLPNIYPAVPPLFRYLSQCSGRLNPNLYDNGRVCVSLLGTWIGKVRAVLNMIAGNVQRANRTYSILTSQLIAAIIVPLIPAVCQKDEKSLVEISFSSS